ncbi:DODA-type extradiol aromatic ring-opening family dioxygenase [Alteraurantiacibacter aquimixticola]|uniref:Dioxygenase n=1 Tax=Alteraurantiacibacter aquimixticola TaxID=2489173 RepID=A0A4V4U9F6_9SPHN|nr:class III extradiol ring-cleavage dioxygenase [Alteraurantiacibacter aquimixticola]TIX50643.1 dioxygenase [Alteraurantiacibacter aquimixticola]
MTETTTASTLPTYYLSHGGGPWPWMPNMAPAYAVLDASLKALRRELDEKPRAVLVVTAHWETEDFTFSAAERPGMIYDYYGFPPETYEITYPAPGLPSLAARAAGLLRDGGMTANIDAARGFDHGTFSLMQAIYPEAAMPIVQMSIRKDFDPALHVEAGKLLAPLRDEGVLVVGSGLSFHNLRAMGPVGRDASRAFDGWLQQALLGATGEPRASNLLDWEKAPAARHVHPREDHLMPLHAAVGAAMEEEAHLSYHQEDFFGAITASSFRFGDAPLPVS